MAEEFDFASRTEAPTPRRRQEAFDEGKFAFSPDLTSGVLLLTAAAGLYFLAPQLGASLLEETRHGLRNINPREAGYDFVMSVTSSLFTKLLAIAGVLVGLLFAATLGISVSQAGVRFKLDKLAIDWEKVSFQWNRLLSMQKIVAALVLAAKIAAVGVVAYVILRQRGGVAMTVGQEHLSVGVARSWNLVASLAIGLTATLFIIGAADYAYQRWRFERSLYMTKQEVKEEMKREDGDPQIKARIRKMQREVAQRKMFQQVPKATVVVTNPTHLAVALRYDPLTMAAPKVVAKGADFVAKRIIEIARKHGVPVVERKPVAQALYKAVKVGRDVPFGLYVIVAELLAYVYRLRGLTTMEQTTSE
jgi:flagellar biosynthetic protein FlhB